MNASGRMNTEKLWLACKRGSNALSAGSPGKRKYQDSGEVGCSHVTACSVLCSSCTVSPSLQRKAVSLTWQTPSLGLPCWWCRKKSGGTIMVPDDSIISRARSRALRVLFLLDAFRALLLYISCQMCHAAVLTPFVRAFVSWTLLPQTSVKVSAAFVHILDTYCDRQHAGPHPE